MTAAERSDGATPWREVGSWSLAYLGPGFRVQLRIARRPGGVRIEGFMTPSLPVTVLLVATQTGATVAESSVGESGRFELGSVSAGAVRLMFLGPDSDRRFQSPPFWL